MDALGFKKKMRMCSAGRVETTKATLQAQHLFLGFDTRLFDSDGPGMAQDILEL